MAVRSSMAALITRVRVLINDPSGASQIFDDQTIQDVLDARRVDLVNVPLTPKPTFTSSQLQYVDYFSEGWADWEDSPTLKQFLTIAVTPSVSENIVGHWQFAANTYPPVFVTGRSYCIYGAAADLLQRWAAKWVLLYSVSVDGQSLQRAQAHKALTDLAKFYRLQQRAGSIAMSRSDAGNGARTGNGGPSLAPTALDYMAQG